MFETTETHPPKPASEHVARFTPEQVAERRDVLHDYSSALIGGGVFVLFVLTVGSPLLAGFSTL